MAQKVFDIEGVGEVIVSKRRGSKNLRLSINSKGQVRVSLPPWTPYAVGVSFAQSRRQWIIEHAQKNPQSLLKHDDRIGKSYRLRFIKLPETQKMSVRISNNEVVVKIPSSSNAADIQKAAKRASEKALRADAEALLPQRLRQLADKHRVAYKGVTVKKLTGRWGSCSSAGQIALSYYLIQLPWNLIDYVIIHELVHTRYLNHGPDFWTEFKKLLPEARQLQKQIRNYKPLLQASI